MDTFTESKYCKKILKIEALEIITCIVFILNFEQYGFSIVMHPNDTDGMTNSTCSP